MPTTTHDSLFERALTHSSWAHEQGGPSNERLEFLGDAVLELCISHLLYAAMPEEREGVLSRVRKRLVNRELLARLALELGLDRGLKVGAGEEAQSIRTEVKPLSDTWEALLGAVYLELGFDASMEVVRATVLPLVDEVRDQRDPKSRLQEWCQRTHDGAVPAYVLQGRSGPDNDPRWTVEVQVQGEPLAQGTGRKKKEAERAAASAALAHIGIDDDSEDGER